MKKEVTWFEKYNIALKENLSIKDIMMLRNVCQRIALEIRDKSIKYCVMNNIYFGGKQVPTEVVLLVTGKDINYYYDKMVLEINALKMHQGIAQKSEK